MYLDKAVEIPAGVEAYTAARIEGIQSEQCEAVYYDLSSRRVENPTKGIYIVNGRKVFIK